MIFGRGVGGFGVDVFGIGASKWDWLLRRGWGSYEWETVLRWEIDSIPGGDDFDGLLAGGVAGAGFGGGFGASVGFGSFAGL
jgi:hypothetical protein